MHLSLGFLSNHRVSIAPDTLFSEMMYPYFSFNFGSMAKKSLMP